ncbi:MAG: TonB-dependent receptor [Tannerella sp.]|jgi:TonB-linked SusC/RagA family outer membrane protein|nr:TonB-dependent receptor [Tannerella sp.]
MNFAYIKKRYRVCYVFFFIFLAFLYVHPIAAQVSIQRKTVTGTVIDEYNEPVIGANVLEKGTVNGTVTDINGHFTLEVQGNALLVISYIGYAEKTVSVGNNTVFNVSLLEDAKLLEEVVVVGYGTQKKVNLTGAISAINAAILENRPITNATQALQGVQGIYVNQAGGQPGNDKATIRIRGQGTLNNNDPLILVDGIEFPLEAINPNDIEHISVLKDAASAAIYGSRAANGVILIKTKMGRKGKFTVDYNNYFGFQQATYLPDFVYDPIVFMEMRNQVQINGGEPTVDYSDELIEEYRQGMKTNPILYPQNNWLDIMYNDAFIMEHNMRFSGGDEKYSYSVSLGYGEQDGVLRGTDSEKYTLAINTSAQMNSRLKIGANMNAHYKIYNEPVTGVANLVEMTYKAQAFHPTYTEDGKYADTFIRTPGHNIYRHPLALADEGENKHKSLRMLANLSAEYKFPFDVIYNLNVGINKYDYLQSVFAPEVYKYQLKTSEKEKIVFDGRNTRHAEKIDKNDLSKTIFNTLSWGKKITDVHDLKILLGFSYEDVHLTEFSAKNEGYLGNDLHELNAGSSNATVGGTSAKSVLMSYFGRLNYAYKDRYLFEANFRYDGSSRFAKGNRWGIFPSFSAGWRLSEECFLKDYSWIYNLKLRASWGQLGNDSWGSVGQERTEWFRYVDLMTSGVNYPLNGVMQSGVAVKAYNDPNITWETTTMTNLGLDASLLNGSLDFSFEIFDKRTTDILRQVTLPDQVGGLQGPIRNIGEVSNKGFELGIGYRSRIGGFGYEITGNMTHVKNKIESLNGQTIIEDMYILKEGEPIDSYYMLHAIGIFQSQEEIDNSPFQTASTKPGYLKFEDTNGDGKITEDDRQIRGGVIPKITYSFGINLSYKDFDLSAFFQGVSDVSTYGDRIGATPLWFGCGLPEQWLTDAWTPERGISAKLPILTTYEGATNENYRTNDFWLRDASYLRLKNLQLSYNVSQSVLKTGIISRLKVFVNAQNLLTFSSMKDFDPEKDLKGGTYYAYPSLRTFTGGVNITF